MTTLARLSFWVPAERVAEFEAEYLQRLVPVLREHGLEETVAHNRPRPAGIFSRLFAVETPTEVIAKERALQRDPAWQEAVRRLGATLGLSETDGALRFSLGLYAAAAGAGKTTLSGPGYRQGLWQSFGVRDGLPSATVFDLLQDREGYLWIGTHGGGVSRYDGAEFTTFTTEDGLVNDEVHALLEDREGRLWIGTHDRGASCYDGEYFTTFTVEDGLAHNAVYALLEDGAGQLWFGTHGGGVSRYDGGKFENFTTEDGLASNQVRSLLEDRQGHLWFGTGWMTEGGGVSRYDGERLTSFTIEDGLVSNTVLCMLEDRHGHLWFATNRGVSRYDGTSFATFTAEDGLPHDNISSMLEDRRGQLWFGTSGGIGRYDGRVFQTLSRQDGLVNDAVQQLLQDRHGAIWIATEGGLTRYLPVGDLPAVRLVEVIADQQYSALQELYLPAGQQVVLFAFQGRSLTTRPQEMAYVYRLAGCDSDWRPGYVGRAEYRDLSLGEYTFQVRAVDRDLNYSEPAAVQVHVVPDPRIEGLTAALSAGGSAGEFVGQSDALHRVQSQLAEVADIDVTVLILGETGTGKGLATRTLHNLSPRAAGPFIPVNCGALPRSLVESELFGHEKGAFTGAHVRKLGKVELAEGGTLFLDEIGDMALDDQVKLLRFLEEGTFERVGGAQTLTADVRVVAATNRDLKQMVAAETFRRDLYYRLEGFPIRLPPLRERREDIRLLALYFMEKMAVHLSKPVVQLDPAALAVLQAYAWPGNVRELEHVIQRAVIVCRESVLRVAHLGLETESALQVSVGDTLTPEEYERQYLRNVLEQTGWVIKGPKGSAVRLGMAPATLRRRLEKLGIRRN